MKIAVLPRDAHNRYQQLLYSALRPLGVRVSYLGELTPSNSLNVLLLPAELALRRAAGARLVHIHWLYRFGLPDHPRLRPLRRLTQWWLGVCLRTARLLGLRLVWTAHNVLPHAPIFADDVAARRTLVAACDLVLAHSRGALDDLAALGAVPRRSAVIPHGPLPPARPAGELRVPGSGGGPRQFLFFGQVHEYKGVEDLLAAFATVPASVPARLIVAGQCPDPALRARLRTLARGAGDRVTLRLDRVPDREVTPLLAAADAVVLPYRRITTSGSAMLALAHGRPLVTPDLPALATLAPDATVSYDRTGPGLAAALTRLAGADAADLAAMSAAATSFAGQVSWPDVAAATMAELTALLAGQPQPAAEPAAEPAAGPAAHPAPELTRES